MKRFGSLVGFYLRNGAAALALAVSLSAVVEFLLPRALRGGSATELRAALHVILWPASLLGLGFATADRDDLARIRLFPISLRRAASARIVAALFLGLALTCFDVALPSLRAEVLAPERQGGGGATVVAAVLLALLPVVSVLAGIVTSRLLPQLAVVLMLLAAPLLAATAAISPYWEETAYPFWYLLAAAPPLAWIAWRAPDLAASQRRPWTPLAVAVGFAVAAPAAYWADVEWLHLAANSALVPHLELTELLDPRAEGVVLVGIERPRSRTIRIDADIDYLMGVGAGSVYLWQPGQATLEHFPEGAERIGYTSDLIAEMPSAGARPGSTARFWARDEAGRYSGMQVDLGPKWSLEKSRWWQPGRGRWVVGLVNGPLVLIEREGSSARSTILAEVFKDFLIGQSWPFETETPALVELGSSVERNTRRFAILSREGRLIATEAEFRGERISGLFREREGDRSSWVAVDCERLVSDESCGVQRIDSQTGRVEAHREIPMENRLRDKGLAEDNVSTGPRHGKRVFVQGNQLYSFAAPESPLSQATGASGTGPWKWAEREEFLLLHDEKNHARLIDTETGRTLELPAVGGSVNLERRGRWLVVLSWLSEKASVIVINTESWTSMSESFPEDISSTWFDERSPAGSQEFVLRNFVLVGLASELVRFDATVGEQLIFWLDNEHFLPLRGGAPRFAVFNTKSGNWVVPRRPDHVERWLEIE